jgi:hypothetical protein
VHAIVGRMRVSYEASKEESVLVRAGVNGVPLFAFLSRAFGPGAAIGLGLRTLNDDCQ